MSSLERGASSLRFSTKQPQIRFSTSVLTDLNSGSEYGYREQDSSSTLSTGQSCHHASRSSFPLQDASFKPGLFETYKKEGEDSASPPLPFANADYVRHQVQMGHPQSLACVTYPYFGKQTADHEPNVAGYSQMMGIEPARVVLPLDIMEGAPIYVNAKQYHAILRRRQNRAKLLAQNKVAKPKKPYLHESRHLHALRRARGSGGRFLNTKNLKQPKPCNKTQDKNLQKINRDVPTSQPKIRHSEKNYSWGGSKTSNSYAACIMTNDDILEQPELRVSIPTLTTGAAVSIERLAAPDDRLLLTMDRRARISTAT